MKSQASASEHAPAAPLVSVIIPHYLGDVLVRCLESICRTTSCVAWELIVVDDQPFDDGSISRARSVMPNLIVTKTQRAHGFGAACNAGLACARGKYAAILNNDVVVAADWLDPLVATAEADPKVGVLQSKIRSLQRPERFDYSGAAGGMMDWLGFPFALGRVFDEIEDDHGQYDTPREIFWAVGAAVFIRRSCLEGTGQFDESFYMHMEEIDLCWRVHARGFSVRSCPRSVVFHENGHSLRQGSFKKAYLNHRNNLILLLKNLPWSRLLMVLPLRVCLIAALAFFGLVRREWRQPLAAILGLLWVGAHFVGILHRRRTARATADAVLPKLHHRSVVADYFLRGVRTASVILSLGRNPLKRVASPMRPVPRSA